MTTTAPAAVQQFPHVSGIHGAPMGRLQTPCAAMGDDMSVLSGARLDLFKVLMVDGAYDDGGAYWGGPEDLWCARADGVELFERAPDRDAAANALRARFPSQGLTFNDERDDYRLEEMVRAFMVAAEWSSLHTTTDDDGEEDTVEVDTLHLEWHPDAIAAARRTCAHFLKNQAADLKGMDAGQAGHDLWLTSQHHGVGFWDRKLGERGDRLTDASHTYTADIEVGDDDLIHYRVPAIVAE